MLSYSYSLFLRPFSPSSLRALFGLFLFLALLLNPVVAMPSILPSAESIVQEAFEYWRGSASTARLTMTIHRLSWERTVSIDAWTQGESESLFVIRAPAKDRGNGTLKKGRGMWIYNPKVNRVIKLPPSMMSQSWQGSDFSNNDLAKTDSLIHDYTHTLKHHAIHGGHTIYTIESTPKSDAPVLWGLITLKIRDDHILLEETFFDEDLVPVKEMVASDIRSVSGKSFPMTWKMVQVASPDRYTRMVYETLAFSQELPPHIFTRAHLISSGR